MEYNSSPEQFEQQERPPRHRQAELTLSSECFPVEVPDCENKQKNNEI
jgi:hypothetical protein